MLEGPSQGHVGVFLEGGRLRGRAAVGRVSAVEVVDGERVAVERGKPIVASRAGRLCWTERGRAAGTVVRVTPAHLRANGGNDERGGGRDREGVGEGGVGEEGRVAGGDLLYSVARAQGESLWLLGDAGRGSSDGAVLAVEGHLGILGHRLQLRTCV